MKKLMILLITLVLFHSIGIVCAAASTNYTSTAAPSNVVVNFDSTSVDSSLRRGDSGTLNLVVQNTGSRRAENVEVWLPGTTSIYIGKKFEIGIMEAGQSKTIPVMLRVNDNASTGMHAIQVRISYDGYDAEGDREDNLLTTWEIPVRVYGNPLFQVSPLRTTYFKDSLDELNLVGLTKDSVKDLEATLSATCATIIGSSRRYIGNVDANKTFYVNYTLKPTSTGACSTSLLFSYTDESGTKVSDNVSIGLNVEEAGVDFKVVNISYMPTGPGETTTITIGLKNTGTADSEDTTLSLSLTDPFVPVDTAERYVGTVSGGQTIYTEFKLAVSWDAETKPYSIPLNVTYKVGGTSHSVKKDIGIDASGKVILEVIKVDSTGGSIRIDVANIGTRTADGVKATLIISTSASDQQTAFNRSRQEGGNISPSTGFPRLNTTQASGTQRIVSYKSDIKPSKQTTFAFSTSATGPATLELEYTGSNNERVTQTERITLSQSASLTGLRTTGRTSGTSTTTYIFYGLVVLLFLWVVYRRYKHEKVVPDSVAQRINRFRSKLRKSK